MEKLEIARRLSVIKHIENSSKSAKIQIQPYSSAAILPLQDAIEQFLFLGCVVMNVPNLKRTPAFESLLQGLDEQVNGGLVLKNEIKRLNTARVGFKHSFIPIANTEIEILQSHAHAFLRENTRVVFDLDYDGLTLVDLVQSVKGKKLLHKAEHNLQDQELDDALLHSHVALDKIIRDYSKRLTERKLFSPFRISAIGTKPYRHKQHTWSGADAISGSFRGMAGDLDKALSQIDYLNESLVLFSLGVQLDDYRKFKRSRPPYMYGARDEIIKWETESSRPATAEDASFSFEFVIDIAIRLQTSDPAAYEELDADQPQDTGSSPSP